MNNGSGLLHIPKWLLMLAIAAMTVFYFAVPPAVGFMEPELARVVLFHLPCAFGCTVYVLLAAGFSLAYLVKKETIWEHRAAAASAVSLVLAIGTMTTGILFSKVQWGEWWHWDPKQTAFLIVLLLLAAYFMVRMAFDETVAKARAAAAYSVVTLLPVLFLIFVFPRLPGVSEKSLHPQDTVQSGKFSPEYKAGYLGLFALLLLFSTWLYRMHVKIAVLEEKDKFDDGNLETSDGSTPSSRVVRPVSLRE
ncbi:MAG: cytochrome c biogenesis protein CcsA [Armatimonadetes bacterium]|nr:cytochrome c biogenesis protein CcsA [Armatimonadota bacterium]